MDDPVIEDADPAARATYPILRGEAGGTVSALSVNAPATQPETTPETTPAPEAPASSGTNTALAVACGVLAVAVIILAVLLLRKKNA